MNTTKIAIIGAGNMGTSLLHGLITTGFPPEDLYIGDPGAEKLVRLKRQFHLNTTQDNLAAIEKAEVVILAVKPNLIQEVAKQLAPIIQKNHPLVISIAAGIREESIQHWLGGNCAIVRCMPNTPALIQCGATALFANPFTSASQRDQAESILRAVSLVVWLESEQQMDAATALSGSGPAYFFLVLEALQEAGESLGLPAETVRLLTLQTALGASRMALESDQNVQMLRQRVTSKGGTTEAAVNTLEAGKIRELFKSALQSAKLRAEELAAHFSKDS